ncbi:MAG TPA: serine/threonine-protein kinase, partial [Gemmataceae bacterium]|nr:serine/threonine-protein kinase [Gemmataceae bacterium]
MNPSDSLQIDEHLARLLAAYDPELGGGDAKAPTIDVPRDQLDGPPPRLTAPAPSSGVVPFEASPVNEGSIGDVLPDSNRTPSYGSGQPIAYTPPPGTTHRIGRFELRRQLGKGGCGIVFLAYDPKLQRELALKIPRPEMLMSEDARRRLIREALAAAEFDHPNLVPVFETGEIGPVCYIATAFCPGQTLAEWLERQSYPVPLRQAARLVATLAEAVQHAHDRGVLHRDLKPNNVILQVVKSDPNDQEPPPGACPLRGDHFIPRIVDFGLAKLAERGPSDTASRQILGTPKYMAPEQAQGRHDDVGPAVDVYALGVVLYELTAGRAPYDGESDVEVLRKAIEGNLTMPRTLRKEMPRDLEAICLKALARTPSKRYRTAIDLADDLRRFLDGKPTIARPLNWVGRAGRWLRRNDQAVALAVVTLIAFFFLTVGGWKSYQARQLRDDRDSALRDQASRTVQDRQREYARHVRDAFLAWRAGDAGQMASSIAMARLASETAMDVAEFALDYLTQLGRAEQSSVACPAGAGTAVAVSPDGAWVVTGHADGTVTVWNRGTGTAASVKAHPAEVQAIAFLHDGKTIVTAGGETTARTWAIGAKGELARGVQLPPLSTATSALAVSADGKRVFVGSVGGECLRWDSADPRAAKAWGAANAEPVVAIAVTPDGKTVATATEHSPTRLWNATTLQAEGEVRGTAGATTLAFAPTAAGWLLAATTEADGTVRLFDAQGREARTLAGHPQPVQCLAVSADGTTLASGAQDDCVCVWDVATGSLRTLLRGHDKPVRGVRFGPDGKSLVTVAEDGHLKTWDLTADPEGHTLRGLPAAVGAVAVHPDGEKYAVAYADGTVEVFARRGAMPKRYPAGERGPIGVLRFPQDGAPFGLELTGRAAVVWE